MSGRKVGTLIVVVLKGKNLPNKRHIGKQDPYCVLKLNGETRRTKAVKRGGQHPDWDDELRFPVYETAEEEVARNARGESPPPPPPKDGDAAKPTKRLMTLACYADDPREPELIGEATVDLTESLTKGETDEWFPLSNKTKYSGEVYLEITYWSEEAPAPKKEAPRPSLAHPQYGGPGAFTPASDVVPSSLRSGASPTGSGRPSFGQQNSPRRDDNLAIPDSLKPSNTLSDLNLYIPPYQGRPGPRSSYGGESYGSRQPSLDDERQRGYEDLGLGNNYPRKRESLPPSGQGQRQSSFGSVAPSNYASPTSAFSQANSISSSFSMMSLGPQRPPPHGQAPPGTFGGAQFYDNGYPQSQYQPNQGMHPVQSGFMPPQSSATPAPSTFGGPGPQFPVAIPSGFGPPPSTQPYAPPQSAIGFHPPPSHFGQPMQPYPPSATPAPYPPSTTPAPYQPYQQQQSNYPSNPPQGYHPVPGNYNPPQAPYQPPPPNPGPPNGFYNNQGPPGGPYYASTTPVPGPPSATHSAPQTPFPPLNQGHPGPPTSAPPHMQPQHQPPHSLPPGNGTHLPHLGMYQTQAQASPSVTPIPPPPLMQGQAPYQQSPPSMGPRPLPVQPGIQVPPPPPSFPGPPPPLPFKAPPPPPPPPHSFHR